MKKTILSTCTLFLSIASNFSLNAQHRSVDLQAVLEAPLPGSTYQVSEPIPFIVSVKNNGPEDLISGDTLFLLLPDNSVRLVNLPMAIGNGESAEIINTQFNLVVNTTTTAKVCIFLFDNPSQQIELGGVPAAISYTDPDSTNNTACNEITIEAEPASIVDLNDNASGLSLYPNPASSSVRVPISKEHMTTLHITVRDMAGRIQTMPSAYRISQLNNEPYADVDISHLNEGLYLVEISYGATSQVGKLIIAR